MRDPERYKVLYIVDDDLNDMERVLFFNRIVSPARAHRLARNYSKRHNIKVKYLFYDPQARRILTKYHDMTGTK